MRTVFRMVLFTGCTAGVDKSPEVDTSGPTPVDSASTAPEAGLRCGDLAFRSCAEVALSCGAALEVSRPGKVCGAAAAELGYAVDAGEGPLVASARMAATVEVFGVTSDGGALEVVGSVVGEVAEGFGHRVVSRGDLDGDGLRDVVVGAPDADYVTGSGSDYTTVGRVYSFFLPIRPGTLAAAADATLDGFTSYHAAGAAVVAVQAPGSSDGVFVGVGGEVNGYAAYVREPTRTGSLSDADLVIRNGDLTAETNDYYVGYEVASADLNGDGVAEVLTTAGLSGAGFVVIADTSLVGTVTWDTLDYYYGRTLGVHTELTAADADCDGYLDLLVRLGDFQGGTLLLPGPVMGGEAYEDAAVAQFGFISEDLAEYAFQTNAHLVSATDESACDAQVLIGTALTDAHAGALLGFTAPFSGSYDETSAVALLGEGTGDEFGPHFAAGGDVNEDGRTDLYVGAPYNDEGGTDAGAVYLFPAGLSP